MKKKFIFLIFIGFILSACFSLKKKSNNENVSNKGQNLIAYFSLNNDLPHGADALTYATPEIGNTESVALAIQKQVGGDLFEICTTKYYPVLHSDVSEIAKKELDGNERPELSTHINNIDAYETIYVGYPIWWYQEPMAIRTFLEEYDFSNKTVIPFCTSLSVDILESQKNIENILSNSHVLKGICINTENEDSTQQISNWLKEIKMK